MKRENKNQGDKWRTFVESKSQQQQRQRRQKKKKRLFPFRCFLSFLTELGYMSGWKESQAGKNWESIKRIKSQETFEHIYRHFLAYIFNFFILIFCLPTTSTLPAHDDLRMLVKSSLSTRQTFPPLPISNVTCSSFLFCRCLSYFYVFLRLKTSQTPKHMKLFWVMSSLSRLFFFPHDDVKGI